MDHSLHTVSSHGQQRVVCTHTDQK